MAPSTAAPCSPTSLHLRLAIIRNSRHLKAPAAPFLPSPPANLHARLAFLSLSSRPNRTPLLHCPHANSSNAPPSPSPDDFAGWSHSDNTPNSSIQQHKKKWVGLEGFVAGVVLVAGLAFAAFALSKRSISRSKQQMEPLTSQQEVSLASDHLDDKVADRKTENHAGIKTDLSSSSSLSPLLHEAPPNENKVLSQELLEKESYFDDKSVTSQVAPFEKLNDNPTINHASLEEVEDASVDPEITPTLPKSSGANTFADLYATVPKSTTDIEQNSVSAEPADLSNAEQTFLTGDPVDLTTSRSFNTDQLGEFPGPKVEQNSIPLMDSNSDAHEPSKSVTISPSITSPEDASSVPEALARDDMEAAIAASLSVSNSLDQCERAKGSTESDHSSSGANYLSESTPDGILSVTASVNPLADNEDIIANNEMNESTSILEPSAPTNSFSSAGIPAPSIVSAALQGLPGRVLVPATVDQVQGQALAALQVLKVIEADVQPGDLCTRREYARWLVVASSALSRSTVSKVYPAMYVEGVTELAFDDITPDDPDFSSIQGLAEAGLISSKLSNRDLLLSSGESLSPFYFTPESPLSRQDLVSWKMALEKRQLQEADRKMLYQLSGFRDIDRINPDAWPALIADLSSGDQGIISLAFGCTRLFQPHKPVTKAQAAVALSTGEAADIVSEELARIEAESMAENAVSAHNALLAEVERDINANFAKELVMEREKINALEKMAEEARVELERLRAQREEDNIALIKERAAIESEMEILSRLRREVEEQLQGLMSNKVEISYEKERISKLQAEAENEKQEITRLQYELEVERKALSMARVWAEEEAKRAREQARALEEAREHWERQGIKVVVDGDLQEESYGGATWLTVGKQLSEGTVSRAENLLGKLKQLADDVKGKSREVIEYIIHKIHFLISILKERASEASMQAKRFKDASISRTMGSIQDLQKNATEFSLAVEEKTRRSIQELQQSAVGFGLAVTEGAKRVAGDCREGVEKINQKFKS